MLWLLHGNMQTPTAWAGVQQGLKEIGYNEANMRTLNIWEFFKDILNEPFKGNFNEETATALQRAGAQLARYIQAEDSKPYLAGYSLGGRLALHALEAEPTLWAGACLISTHPGFEKHEAAARSQRLQTDTQWAQRATTQPWERFIHTWNAQPIFQNTLQHNKSQNLALYASRIAAAFQHFSLAHQANMRPTLAAAPCHIHWVTGAADAKFNTLANTLPPAQHIKHTTLPNTGHRIPTQAPQALCKILEATSPL